MILAVDFSRFNATGVDQVPGLVVQRQLHGKEVTLAQQVVQVLKASQEIRLDVVNDRLIDTTDVDGANPHSKCLGAQRQLLTACAKADDRQRFARQAPLPSERT